MKKVLETLAQIHDHAAEPTEGWGGGRGGARKRKKEGSEGGQQGKREKQGVV